MTDEQIMRHLYVLADFVYGETFSTNDKYEDVICGNSLFRIYKKDNEVLNEVKNRLVGNPWHTGTPTEKGAYLIKLESQDREVSYTIMPMEAVICGNKLYMKNDELSIVAWHKIEER